MRRTLLVLLTLCALAPTAARAADFEPDPRAVQRYGPAYRYPQAGWIVLHIEGEPYERGVQHGRLLATEIAAHVRCFAAVQNPKSPAEGWKQTRTLANALFLRRYDKEYLEEMRGIADGATAAGARYENRPIDLIDIAGVNCWPEIETLEGALEATETGLEGKRFRHSQTREMPDPKPMHCSAFAATGPATKDGRIVFGHITMFGLYSSYFYNVWLDVKPTKGHRVMMQTYPGGIQSGLDYYMNDSGILVTETTIAQTRFDISGMSLASRIRESLQYADTIDKACDILKKGNNGLYTNEWLLADIKTNEIAMFELGTHKSRLYRSGSNDWFGGTTGFYWGCNNTKDREVRLETIAGVNGRPANMVFCPSDRDKMWVKLYEENKGKIDASFGKLAFTTPPLAAYHSLDAKFTTTEMAKNLQTWALFGPPLGRTWEPTLEERKRFPDIKPLVGNPWTILHVMPPVNNKGSDPIAVDIPEKVGDAHVAEARERRRQQPTEPAWLGTIFPKTDADIWLATAFADYERFVSHEKTLRDKEDENKKSDLSPRDRDALAIDLFGQRSAYLTSSRMHGDVPLNATQRSYTQSNWYRIAAGKGCLVLHELRQLLGKSKFTEVMEAFGKEHAGKEVASAEFRTHAEKIAGKPLDDFFAYWLKETGLPTLKLGNARVTGEGKAYRVDGELLRSERSPQLTVQVTVETGKDEVTKSFTLSAANTPFTVETTEPPQRVVIDKYGMTAKANGGIFSLLSFHAELDKSLIVYGTADEISTNKEAAEAVQRGIVQRYTNFTVPLKKDTEVSDDDLKSHHLLLIGRPDSNPLVKRFSAGLPISFGSRSFTVRNETYAHSGSAVIAAAPNPLNPRYSIVVLAGLNAESTLQTPAALLRGLAGGEVLVLPNHGRPHALIIPAKELVKEFGPANGVVRAKELKRTESR